MAENTQKLTIRLRGDSAECEEDSDEDGVEGGEECACDAAQSAEMICACTYTHRPFERLLHGDLRCGAGSDLHQIETLEGG